MSDRKSILALGGNADGQVLAAANSTGCRQ